MAGTNVAAVRISSQRNGRVGRLTAGAVAVAGVLVLSACAEQSAAVRVGGSYVSEADFRDELDELHELALGAEAADLSSYDQQMVAQVATSHAQSLLLAQMFEDHGLSLDAVDGEVLCARELVTRDPMSAGMYLHGQDYAFPTTPAEQEAEIEELAERLAADQAALGVGTCDSLTGGAAQPDEQRQRETDALVRVLALEEAIGMEAVQREVGEIDVSVNSKFGSWDTDTLQVVPPEGPLLQQDDEFGEFDDIDIEDLLESELP